MRFLFWYHKMDSITVVSITTLPIALPVITTDGALRILVRAVLVHCADTVVLSYYTEAEWSN